jgi:energy-coupling factor transporter ATP-binding protein EcfA2
MKVLLGQNFSGRTDFLKTWVNKSKDIQQKHSYKGIYLGPDPLTSLSGLAPTVISEFELMATDAISLKKTILSFIELGFEYCLHRNPQTLSGGEQVVVCIFSAIACQPSFLAIDCLLEQLSHETRIKLTNYLITLDIEYCLVDNRHDEWYEGETLQVGSDIELLDSSAGVCLNLQSSASDIELIDLGHSYDKKEYVFQGLNLSIDTSKCYHLAGSNGSGKTTLSKILCGLIKPTTGEIRLDGKRIKPWREPGKITAYHFQNPSFQLFASRVADQFTCNDKLRGDLSSYFGIENCLNEHPLDLPYVLKKRVALASTIMLQRRLLILDEPTLGQDNRFVSRLTSANLGVSYIAISHSQKFLGLRKICMDTKSVYESP